MAIILIPALEIYLFIKIGSQIGAITTIFFIFTTAVVGIYYAKYEGLNTLKSGFAQLSKNKTPTNEMISGAAIAFGALLLIISVLLVTSQPLYPNAYIIASHYHAISGPALKLLSQFLGLHILQ